MSDNRRSRLRVFTFLAGLIAGPAGVLLMLAGFARYLPDSSIFQAVGRVSDSIAPHLLAVVTVLALLVLLLGARRFGILLILGACVAFAGHFYQHFERTTPMLEEARVDLRLLWFNMFSDNDVGTEAIVDGLLGSDADVIILAESERMVFHLSKLQEAYPHQLGCTQICQVLILSKIPFNEARQGQLSIMSPERFARVDLTTSAGPVTIIGAHLNKPWFDEFSTDEAHNLAHRVEEIDAPLVLVGDMNSAPWSRRMAHFHQDTGWKFALFPPATWPASAGAYGVPIDNALVGGGAQFVSLEAWGHDMGSNHLGLLAKISLPQSLDN